MMAVLSAVAVPCVPTKMSVTNRCSVQTTDIKRIKAAEYQLHRPGSRRSHLADGEQTSDLKCPPALAPDTGHDAKFPCICINMSKIYF